MSASSESTVQCVGFIMDGNRRWAKQQGTRQYNGHRQGGEAFRESMRWVQAANIPHAVYYAFSTENWQRNASEVASIMDLLREMLADIETKRRDPQRTDADIHLRFVGRRADFPSDIQEQIDRLEQQNSLYPDAALTAWVALSYGGRAEIVAAVNEAVVRGESVTEDSFAALLWTADMPDPDLIIRTGGERRLSNFLAWRSVYSELFFTKTYWPSLTKDEFDDILKAYETRERRRGG